MMMMQPSLDSQFDSPDEDSPVAPPRRARSIATTSHKYLRQDEPTFYDSLHQIWAQPARDVSLQKLIEARPESPTDACDQREEAATAALETLANQTLEDLFAEDKDAKRRHSVAGATNLGLTKSIRAHAARRLDEGGEPLRTIKQPKTSSPVLPSATVPALRRHHSLGGAGMWLKALAKRKAIAPQTDSPPPGWSPTLQTVIAVLKLRKMHEAREASEAPLEAHELDETVQVSEKELQELADPQDPGFDAQAFIEECWVAQSLADPEFNETLLQGAYQEAWPVHAEQHPWHVHAEQPQPWAMQAHEAWQSQAWAVQQAQPPWTVPVALPPAGPAFGMGFAPPTMLVQPPQHQHQHQHPPMAYQYAPQPAYATFAMQQPWQPAMAPAAAPMAPPMVGAPAPLVAPRNTWHGAAAAAARRGGGGGGGLAAMAQEQEGSRLLQQRLVAMGPAELATAIEELAPHLPSLATNAFGNYLVSMMAGLPAAHAVVHAALSGDVCRMMAHAQGSRVVQAALERLPPTSVARLVAELEGHVAEVACSTHGSWSVVAAYKHAGRPPFILTELAAELPRLAVQQNGSRVVQRVLQEEAAAGGDISTPTHALLSLDKRALHALADDKFGNYVVQLALRHAPPTQRAVLVERLLSAFGTLAVSKCGSNVAEVVVQLATDAQLAAVRAALSARDIEVLGMHMFGSYVMTALALRNEP